MPFHFGVGKGRLSKAEIKRRQRAAEKHGATFVAVHGNQGHCECGHGCRLDTCPVMRYWYTAPNLGAPFDQATARAVEAELSQGAAR